MPACVTQVVIYIVLCQSEISRLLMINYIQQLRDLIIYPALKHQSLSRNAAYYFGPETEI